MSKYSPVPDDDCVRGLGSDGIDQLRALCLCNAYEGGELIARGVAFSRRVIELAFAAARAEQDHSGRGRMLAALLHNLALLRERDRLQAAAVDEEARRVGGKQVA